MRKLASIKQITNINEIIGADAVELATIENGWNCVVKKNEFQVGDKSVYFEIDSVLPSTDNRFEFLSSKFKNINTEDGITHGFLLKTMKIRGELSQGLVLPLGMFEELKNLELGADATDILNIKKYEPVENYSSNTNGDSTKRPDHIPKTEQERIQNMNRHLREIQKNTFEVTQKLDGSSITVFADGETIGVCSRNLLITDVNSQFYKCAEKENLLDIVQFIKNRFNFNVAINGEMIGEGIQKNPELIKGIKFYLFDIYNIDKCQYLTPKEREEVLTVINSESGYTLKHVPILDKNFTFSENLNIQNLLKLAEGKSLLNSNAIREGIIFKSNDRNKYFHHNPITFKVINNQYLLKK